MNENRQTDNIPPVGATPYDSYAVDRINELLGAIGRFVNDKPLTCDALGKAKFWATEIIEQIELIEYMYICEDD